MKRLIHFALGGVLWLAALLGALQIRLVEGNWGHFLCGPWGCGPPLQALVACHLFWLTLLAPPIIAVGVAGSRSVRAAVGAMLLLLGVGALIGIAIWEAVYWAPLMSDVTVKVYLQRVFFQLAVSVDWPIMPCILGGALLWMTSGRNGRIGKPLGNPFAPAAEASTNADNPTA